MLYMHLQKISEANGKYNIKLYYKGKISQNTFKC